MSLQHADDIVKELWDRDVKAWQTYWVPIFRKFARHLILDARISSSQIVLDIGTGTGVAAFEAARKARPEGFVFGIDRLEPMLAVARTISAEKTIKNIRFVLMDGKQLFFPTGLFDVVTSNCGISPVGFRQTIGEVFRVLRRGGTFVYDDWRLQDVRAHRTFGEILQEHRTNNPSRKLSIQRTALATLERFGNHEMDLDAQLREVSRTGFRKIEVKSRNYKIALHDIEEYLDMRLKRAALKQELAELPAARRKGLLCALREGLRPFVRDRRFGFDWKVTFVRARKT